VWDFLREKSLGFFESKQDKTSAYTNTSTSMGSHIPSTANGSFQVTLEVLSLIDRQAEMTENASET